MIKFNGYIDINRPVELVAELFADPNNLKEYQDGFVRKDLVEGEAGQVGAISKMIYLYGKNEMELIETITENNLPESFAANYHHVHMDNTMKCSFKSLSDDQTRYAYEYEYTRIEWVIPRLMTILFPNMYRKQGEKWITQFKDFVESQ